MNVMGNKLNIETCESMKEGEEWQHDIWRLGGFRSFMETK